MKKTLISIALAAVMALGVGSVAFAETYVPAAVDDGDNTIITIEVTEEPPVNISATVPVELPFVVVRDSDAGVATEAVKTYYPQDGWYGVTNTCNNEVQKTNDAGDPLYKDAATGAETTTADGNDPIMIKKDVTIRVNEVSVAHYDPLNVQWTLVPAASVATPAVDNGFQLNTTIGDVELPALGASTVVAQHIARPETPGAEAMWKNIDQDAKLVLPVTAQAGGTNAAYTENVAKANAFKVVYTIGKAPVTPAP